MRLPLVIRLKESQHQPLFVGWLGLLAIAVVVVAQFQEISDLVELAIGSVPAGSFPEALFVGIFPHALSAVAIVSLIGMVAIQGPIRMKSLMLVMSIFALVATEYHWPANWTSEDELRVLASLAFMFMVAAVAMSVIAVSMRAFCGCHFVVGTEISALRRSVSLFELIMLTGLAACTIALGRQTQFSLSELLEWSFGAVAYAGVLSLRLLSLADDPVLRRRGRLLGMLCFSVLQVAEACWPFDEIPHFSLASGVASGLAAFASAIVYWFMTMLPILWMKVNDWRVVSSSSTCSLEPDVDRTTS